MSIKSYIQNLLDKNGDLVYPVTSAQATYMRDNMRTVQDEFDDLKDQNTHIKFKPNGDIEKTLATGNVITYSFPNDGSILEVCKTKAGKQLYSKKTVFNNDDSIDIRIT